MDVENTGRAQGLELREIVCALGRGKPKLLAVGVGVGGVVVVVIVVVVVVGGRVIVRRRRRTRRALAVAAAARRRSSRTSISSSNSHRRKRRAVAFGAFGAARLGPARCVILLEQSGHQPFGILGGV